MYVCQIKRVPLVSVLVLSFSSREALRLMRELARLKAAGGASVHFTYTSGDEAFSSTHENPLVML